MQAHAPCVGLEDFAPKLFVISELLDLSISAESGVTALCANLSLAHLEVFSHDEYHLDLIVERVLLSEHGVEGLLLSLLYQRVLVFIT